MAAQGERIQASCRIIWGPGDYDIDVKTDDWVYYQAAVCQDFGTFFGVPLTMTGLCRSYEHARDELDRMLRVWARQTQTGLPMTKEKVLEIFGGPGGNNRGTLEMFMDEKERRERTSELKNAAMTQPQGKKPQ